MKILIIADSRTGSTNLTNWIGYEFGSTIIHEPYNPWRKDNPEIKLLKMKNVCVKINPHDVKDTIPDITTFQNNFDKVVLLMRTNFREQSISLLHAENSGDWHSSYFLDDEWLKKNEDKIKKYEDQLIERNKETLRWKTENNILITYEGIYIDKGDLPILKKYLGLEKTKYEDIMLSDKQKYRKHNPLIKKIM